MTTTRTRLAHLSVASALAASVLLVAVAATPSGATTGPPVVYESANTPGQVIDVPGGSLTPGTPLEQWTVNNGDNQRWQSLLFTRIGDSDVAVIQSLASGLVLDVAGSSTADGAPIVQSAWSGAAGQIWWLMSFGGSAAVFVNMGSGKVLDIAGASHADGAPLIQWTWNGGANQVWSPFAFITVS